MSFSKILRGLRTDANVTQKELALELGFCKNIICEWEHGRCEPSIDALKKIGAFFSVSVDYLIGNSDDFGNIGATPKEFGATDLNPLTSQEKALLNCFDKLDEYQRESIMIQVKALAEKAEQMVK